MFGEFVQTQITENYLKAKTHQEKANFKRLLSGPTADKYKLWRFGHSAVTYKKLGHNNYRKKSKDKKNSVIKMIQKFYEDDSNSRNAARKKECITRNYIKKQKRYLLDSLKNLHKKFLQTFPDGYSLFCKLRPFWVVSPKLSDRDTICTCIVHENINLKLSALKNSKILEFGNYQSVLQTLCCDRYSEECVMTAAKKLYPI